MIKKGYQIRTIRISGGVVLSVPEPGTLPSSVIDSASQQTGDGVL